MPYPFFNGHLFTKLNKFCYWNDNPITGSHYLFLSMIKIRYCDCSVINKRQWINLWKYKNQLNVVMLIKAWLRYHFWKADISSWLWNRRCKILKSFFTNLLTKFLLFSFLCTPQTLTHGVSEYHLLVCLLKRIIISGFVHFCHLFPLND